MSRERLFPLLKRPAPLLEALGRRPLLGGQVRAVNSGLEAMKEAKRLEWREKGYPEGFINTALVQAEEWASSMSEAFAPPELREAAMRHNYPKALEVSQRWISAVAVPTKR